MATWPTTDNFPQSPLVTSWTRRAINALYEFKPEFGPARKRRMTTGVSYECSGVFLLIEGHQDILLDFWRDDCNFGSESFTWIDPEDGITVRTWEFKSVPEFSQASAGFYETTVNLIRQS